MQTSSIAFCSSRRVGLYVGAHRIWLAKCIFVIQKIISGRCNCLVQVGGGLAIPLAALGACALLSYNKTTSQGPLQSRQPPMISAHGRDQQSDDAPSVAVSAAPPHDLVLRAGIPSGTLRDGVSPCLDVFLESRRLCVCRYLDNRYIWQAYHNGHKGEQNAC